MQFRSGPRTCEVVRTCLACDAGSKKKAKAVVAKGAAVLKTTGLRVGEQVVVTSTVPNVSAGSGLGKYNFNTVTNQSLEVVMSVLDAGELKVAFDNYKAVFGVFPPAEHDAEAQIAGHDILFRWVDHSNRGGRVLRTLLEQVLRLSSDGFDLVEGS